MHSGNLHNKKFLVTAGPTVEAIDPVRFISNHSTGKMGYAVAAELAARGADVTLVSGPVALPAPEGVGRIDVVSAEDMYRACIELWPRMDGAVMCAAVADYTPAEVSPTKIKKRASDYLGSGLNLGSGARPESVSGSGTSPYPAETCEGCIALLLKPTRDIAAELGRTKREGQLLVGFALETDNEEANALSKLHRKNLDLIVLNSLRDPGAGFGGDTNLITIFDRSGSKTTYPLESKSAAARRIVNHLERI